MAESQIGIYSRAPRRGTRPPTANLTRSKEPARSRGLQTSATPLIPKSHESSVD